MTSKQHIATRVKCYGENFHDLLHLSKPQLSIDDKSLKDDLRRNGYSVIENFISSEHCDALAKEIDLVIKKYNKETWKDEHQSDHRVFGAERASSIIKDFHTNERLKTIGEAYLKTKVDNYMTLAARLEASEVNLGSGGGWHRDSSYEHQYKSIIYLSNVGEDNGPFQFVKNSHKTGSVLKTVGIGINNNRYSHDEIEDLINQYKLKLETFTAKKGTVILVDTKGLHRGMPIKSGVRYALTNYYIGAYKRDRFHSYFKDLVIEK